MPSVHKVVDLEPLTEIGQAGGKRGTSVIPFFVDDPPLACKNAVNFLINCIAGR
jgi:hypothetical protein